MTVTTTAATNEVSTINLLVINEKGDVERPETRRPASIVAKRSSCLLRYSRFCHSLSLLAACLVVELEHTRFGSNYSNCPLQQTPLTNKPAD